MHYSTLIALAIALSAGLTAASNCAEGLDYCGYNLLKKGNYYNDIIAALKADGQPGDDNRVKWTLFHCGGPDTTPVQKYCGINKCIDGGNGKDDFCNN